MHLQGAAAIIANESQRSKPIHEETDPRPGCAYHLCKGLLTHLGDYSLGRPFLSEVRKQQQKPS